MLFVFDFSEARKLNQKVENSMKFQIFLTATHLFLFINNILHAHILSMLHKKLLCVAQKTMCVNKKILHTEVASQPKSCESQKNMLWQQKKLCDTQKRESCWLNTEAATQRCSEEKVLWKYATNLQENTHAEVRF